MHILAFVDNRILIFTVNLKSQIVIYFLLILMTKTEIWLILLIFMINITLISYKFILLIYRANKQ